MGVLLPLLETYRRGIEHWRLDFTTMFEDYLAGALLLAGAWAVGRRRSFGAPLLLAAWAWVAGLVTISFVRQVEVTLRGTDLERRVDVFVVKAIFTAVSLLALTGCLRDATRSVTPNER